MNTSSSSTTSRANKKNTVENMDEDTMDITQEDADVVCWRNRTCQTRNARWLSLDKIYEKLQRPNFYEVGNTYINDVLEYTFTVKVENVGTLFLLHLFVGNTHEGSFKIKVNEGNDLKLDRKNGKAFLSSISKEHRFDNSPEGSVNYVTTYSFSEQDVDLLKDKRLYIAMSYLEGKGINQEIIDDVKASHDFGALLSESIGCDFTIKSLDGETFKVHKAMLVAHSEVFKAMLKEDTAESQNNFVTLDVMKEDLQCILEFIYTGTVSDLENSNWFNLLMYADKYDLKGLRELSEHALAQQLTVDNVLEVLIVADMSNSEDLKTAALKFIKKNPSALQTSTFKEIKNVSLMGELCKACAFAVN
ncbi:speckle-type POZ protein B-like isoform X1 [Cydia strobilella]|uniref:speckle-type POZ protein B-like isoform X1 n=1 Tax=Cydia strobilella TaxID=1100964 RepID=UPI003007995D